MIVYLQYAANSFNIWAENKRSFDHTELFSDVFSHVIL